MSKDGGKSGPAQRYASVECEEANFGVDDKRQRKQGGGDEDDCSQLIV